MRVPEDLVELWTWCRHCGEAGPLSVVVMHWRALAEGGR